MHMFLCAVAVLGCGLLLPTIAGTTVPTSEMDSLLMARVAGVENFARPYPWLYTGGQPDPTAIRALAGVGVWNVIDMRAADEPRGFEERELVKSLGLGYLHIPTRVGDFKDSRFTAFRHHLIAHGPKKPLFVHCETGDRVGAALLPWMVLDQGMTQDDALATARKMGLHDEALTALAIDYIRRHERKR
jgi:protein tyrosine phosphatase (PTP) superfamily phosphohydrolase (DUF442 family)